jgi:uncharacterized protein YbjT (DUF2867 family)
VIAGSRSGNPVGDVPGRTVDFNDPTQLAEAFKGVDRLFLVFPLASNKIALATNAVAAAKAAGVKHIVRSSGAGAEAQSPVAIARLQGIVDQLVINSGVPYTLLLPNSFMQNWISYYTGMIKTGALYLSHAEGKVSFVDVRDIAGVAAAVLLNPAAHNGKSYTLTGSQALSAAEGLAEIAKASGRVAQYVPVPESAAIDAMKNMGMDEWTIEMLSSLNQIIAAGYASGISPDVESVTGKPARTFSAFAQDQANIWR